MTEADLLAKTQVSPNPIEIGLWKPILRAKGEWNLFPWLTFSLLYF